MSVVERKSGDSVYREMHEAVGVGYYITWSDVYGTAESAIEKKKYKKRRGYGMSKLNQATRILRERFQMLKNTDKNNQFYAVRKARFAEILARVQRMIKVRGGDPTKVVV
jgi:hypothetical protein